MHFWCPNTWGKYSISRAAFCLPEKSLASWSKSTQTIKVNRKADLSLHGCSLESKLSHKYCAKS